MPIEITFVRHAESTSNVAGRWQGQGNAPLSEHGERQAAALGKRLVDESFDVVVGSDLKRAAQTAEPLPVTPELDAAWREINVGAWEGLTRDEVLERFPGEIAQLRQGEDIAIGGGESWADMHARVGEAFEQLCARLWNTSGGRGLVVSHGGVIHGLVSALMGLGERRPRPIGRLGNTAITTVRLHGDGEAELLLYNDPSHLQTLVPFAHERLEAGNAVIALIAHDEREARDDRACADTIARWTPGIEVLYATETAADAARHMGTRLGVGAAEPLVNAHTLHDVVKHLAEEHGGKRVGVVTSRDAIAEYARSVFGYEATTTRLAAPQPRGLCHVVATSQGHTFVDYNLGWL